MEEIMQSNSFFIVPLTLAYGSICGLWFMLTRRGYMWKIEPISLPSRPRLELVIGLVACMAILLTGQLYSAGYFLPGSDNVVIHHLIVWPMNNLLIFSPILLVLLFRRQSLKTIFISGKDILYKLAFGSGSAALGVLVFVGFRGEWYRIMDIANNAVQLDALTNFPAVFLENVAVAFLFVRMKWTLGTKWAIGIPALLFAVAHIPGSLAEGDSWGHIITFFFLTGGLTTMILYTAYRGRDIIWLGIVHYMMDLAIKVF